MAGLRSLVQQDFRASIVWRYLFGLGLGWGGHWYLVSKDLQILQNYAAATYEQTKPPEPKTRGE